MLLAKGQRNVIVYLYKVIILYCIRIMSLVIVFGLFFSQKRHSKAPQKKNILRRSHDSKEYYYSRRRLSSLLSHPLARPFVVKEEEKDLIKRE